MYKLLVSFFSILTSFVFLFAQTTFALTFPDINSNTDYNKEIEYIVGQGYASGFSDGTFKPLNAITRAEFTKILINAKFSSSEITNCQNIHTITFPDISSDNIFRNYICLAQREGIINGFSDGTFKPENDITFGEAAKIAFRSLYERISLSFDAQLIEYINLLDHTDSYPPTLLSRDINRSKDASLNRAEMSYLIYRILEVYDDMFYWDLYKNETHSYINDDGILKLGIGGEGHITEQNVNFTTNNWDLDCTSGFMGIDISIIEKGVTETVNLKMECSTGLSSTYSYKDYFIMELSDFDLSAPYVLLKITLLK